MLRPVAALVRAIEAACPNVRVLATSCEGLGIRGEQNLTVPSLEVPDDASSLEAFVQRARAWTNHYRAGALVNRKVETYGDYPLRACAPLYDEWLP